MGHDPAAVTVARTHDLDAVVALYRAVGWTGYAERPDVLAVALAGSSRVVTAHRDGRLVGLARVVSDGASVCYLQDVLVHPDERRRGTGRQLVLAVLQPYGAVRQKVLLTDDEPGQRAFYESLGYSEVREHGDGSLRAFVRFDG
ncbi:GNAT family N-acetyltransferase [Aquipuribacter sp. SD81]|uniref:GNAT family N-acetyltransferase n=1 Tax=Aquipuribacter sp. SD81 TaxID=3127703 RepID=UPI0030166D9C